jgi:hypothetical protein
MKTDLQLVSRYAEMWPRNLENINHVPGKKDGGTGVYILYDGSMPVYVGKGNIKSRLDGARRSKSRGPFWDHFSWYILKNPAMIHDAEVLILRMLPPYLRSLTKQKGHFLGGIHGEKDIVNPDADHISRRAPKKRKKKS